MRQRKDIVLLSVNTLICALTIVGMALFMREWGWLVQTAFYALGCGGLIVGLVLFFLKKEALLKSVFVIEAFFMVTLALLILINEVWHLDRYPTDAEKIGYITDSIRKTGGWGMVIYVIIQILQIVILPLPAWLFYVSGAQIWGPGIATLLASIGVLAGSLIAYSIGRAFGRKVVVWIAGQEATDKYAPMLAHKGKVLFILMQVLPFFPDDILCLVAGMTGMNVAFFTTVMFLVRPAIIAVYCYGGSGELIPFSGWGIPVWIALFVVCAVGMVLYWKYQDRIENWFVEKVLRGKHGKQTEQGGAAADSNVIVADAAASGARTASEVDTASSDVERSAVNAVGQNVAADSGETQPQITASSQSSEEK